MYVLQIIRFQWGKEYPYRKTENSKYMEKKVPAILSGVPVRLGFKKVPPAEVFYNSRAETWVAHV